MSSKVNSTNASLQNKKKYVLISNKAKNQYFFRDLYAELESFLCSSETIREIAQYTEKSIKKV